MSFWGRVLAAGAEDSFTDSYKPKKQAREACSAFGVRSCTRTQEMPHDGGRRDCLYQPHKRSRTAYERCELPRSRPASGRSLLTPGQRGETPPETPARQLGQHAS